MDSLLPTTRHGYLELGRFLLVGGTTFCLYFVVYFVVERIAGGIAAVTISYVVAVTFHYLTNRSFTFGRDGLTRAAWLGEILRYAGALFIGYAVNMGAFLIARDVLHVPGALGLLAGVTANTVISYMLLRNWVFKATS